MHIFYWGSYGRPDSLPISSPFFQSNFQMLSFLKFVDWLISNFMWGIQGRASTKVMEIMLIEHFLPFLQLFLYFVSQIFKFSENPWPIDFKCQVRHPGEGLYQSYGNYADAAILSAEHQVLWASCYASGMLLVNLPPVASWGKLIILSLDICDFLKVFFVRLSLADRW